MFEEKCYKFGLDYTRFVRNYYLDKVKKGERINQDDLKYVFIECNLQLTECIEIFNVSYSKLRSDLKHFNIVKSPLLQQKNREKNCIKKYNVINPSCLNEVKEKRKQTNIKRYGYANSSMNVEIKQKIQETMQKRYGGNAPACDPKILEKIKKTNLEKYGEEWAWKTEEGKKKQKDACVAKYGVNNPMLLSEIQEKAKLTKLKKYGRTNVGQFGTEEHNKAI